VYCGGPDKAKQKLKLFGHICRTNDNRLIKTVMLGIVEGDRPRGRPEKEIV